MTAALRPRYTMAEYMAIERASSGVRHEYVAGEVFAMAGGTPEHAALAGAFGGQLHLQLRGSPCRVYSADLQISVRSAEVTTYADVSVVCDPRQHDPDAPSCVVNPRVVIEVLSPSTERYDREQKRLYYQQLESLREYVLVAHDQRRVEVWHRGGADEEWARTTYGPSEVATLASIGCSVPIDALYDEAGVLPPG